MNKREDDYLKPFYSWRPHACNPKLKIFRVFTTLTLEPLNLSIVSLDDIFKTILANLASQINTSHAQIEVELLPSVEADGERIYQLFAQILDNALKFNKEGVPPQIHVMCEMDDENGRIRVLIQDNGIGFDAQFENRIFRPFQRLHSIDDYPGTGIGLAICRKIVEQHKGEIAVTSQLGEGTTISVTLPLEIVNKTELS